MMTLLRTFLMDNWSTVLPHLPRPSAVHFLLTKGSIGDHGGRVSFFVFADGAARPAAIAKIARDPKSDHLITVEHTALRFIHDTATSETARKVPKPFYLGSLDAYKLTVEEAVTGKSIDAVITNRLFGREKAAARMLRSTTDWLTRFQKELASKTGSRIGEGDAPRFLGEPLERFEQIYAPSGKELALLQEIRSSLPSLAQAKLPLVCEHGDFSSINVLFSSNDFWIIDWEHWKDKGLPLHDLFFLLTFYAFRVNTSKPHGLFVLDNFNEMFLKEGGRAELGSEVIGNYCAALGIGTAAVKPLFGLFLVNCANYEHDVLCKQADRGFIPVIAPFGKDTSYGDGTLMRNNIYYHLFKRLAEHSGNFIF